MRSAPYSLAALREYRRRKEQGKTAVPLTLADIPPDAHMEEGIELGCWNGQAFVSWERWLTSQLAEAFRVSLEDDHDRAR